MSKTVRVFVWSQGRYEEPFMGEKSLEEMHSWLGEIVANVPSEFLSDVRFSWWDTDDGSYQLQAYYSRPETDEERAYRESRIAITAAQLMEREKQEFERLKAKYGAGGS